jgi:membrane protease subunit HflK
MAARLVQEAEAYLASVVQKAEGDASRFKQILVEYAMAPEVTRERLYLDMMQSVLGNSSKVLVDQSKNGQSLLYLPLDKLIQQSAAPASAPAAPEAARQPSAAGASDSSVTLDPGAARSRSDALRNRERASEGR